MRLSTDTVAERNKLDYWREIVCDTFVELQCRAGRSHGFYGAIESDELSDIRFTRVTSTTQHVVRTSRRIARSDLEYFFLSLQLHGRGCHKQDGRVAWLEPGDFVIYDTTRPYELLFGDPFSQLVLSLPRELVKSRLTDAERLTACTVQSRSGSGRLASAFIRQLAGQIHALGPASLPRLHATVVDLIATAVAEQRREACPALSRSRNVLTQQILQFIEDRLRDPDLSCATIAAKHRISERYLRVLFYEVNPQPEAIPVHFPTISNLLLNGASCAPPNPARLDDPLCYNSQWVTGDPYRTWPREATARTATSGAPRSLSRSGWDRRRGECRRRAMLCDRLLRARDARDAASHESSLPARVPASRRRLRHDFRTGRTAHRDAVCSGRRGAGLRGDRPVDDLAGQGRGRPGRTLCPAGRRPPAAQRRTAVARTEFPAGLRASDGRRHRPPPSPFLTRYR